MIDQQSAQILALELDQAEQQRKQIALISQRFPDAGMAHAYTIQEHWMELKYAQGRRRIGWKIGLTSRAMQSALNIDIPDSGVLLDDMIFDDGALIAGDRFIQPRVEAEIAFLLKSPLQGEGVSVEDVLAATQAVIPAIEILDTRIIRVDPRTGRARTIVDTIADNAANAGIVLGKQQWPVDKFDLRWVGAIVSRDNEVEETGLGAGVLNNPALGIVWLVRRLAGFGQSLNAGEIVLSGSFIRPLEAPPGSLIVADFGSFGKVSCRFGS